MLQTRASAPVFAAIAAALAAVCAQAQLHHGADLTFVPWKVLVPGEAAAIQGVALYWSPSSRDELRRSPLLISRALALESTRCVAMFVVRPDDEARLTQLHVAAATSAAIVVDRDGLELARIDGPPGSLEATAVERMVHTSLARTEADADGMLDQARALAESGQRDAAITLYRKVCARRCSFPRKAHDADRALRKLGADEP